MAKIYDETRCPVAAAHNVIHGKWKLKVIYELKGGTKRFNELLRNIGEVKQAALTKQLRELESDKIITREAYAEVPPRVEYSLTELGCELLPIIMELYQWGEKYLAYIDNDSQLD